MSAQDTARALEARARSNAGRDRTGRATSGDIGVVYYPRCQRHRWFNRDGFINKADALLRLGRRRLVKTK